METKTKEYFETELENILNIHFDAKYYLEDVKYLNNPESNEEKIAAVEYFIIKRIRIAFWRLGIIEIAKLFQKSRSQHYNLINFLEELILNYDQYAWIHDLPKNMLEEWIGILNSEKLLSLRERIRVQRNNYFAHTDKNPKIKLSNVQIEFEEINTLISLTESIIFQLKVYCFSTHSDFEITGLERAGNILLAFVALKEKKESEIKREWEDYLNERNNQSST